MITEHAAEWLGYPVQVYDPDGGKPDYAHTVYRLAAEWDDERTLVEQFAQFVEDPASAETPALILGLFGTDGESSQPIVEALVAAHLRLPKLKGIFLGDILSEENEISWIVQTDVAPLFAAYPQLEHFRVRGAGALSLGRLVHEKLRSLIIESGGLPVQVLREVFAAKLPALDHLELWLGTVGYGWDGAIADLGPLWGGDLFPKLKYLGLRDSEIADEVAAAVATAPILGRVETLDLSLGTLTDAGAEALLASPHLRSLKMLDLHRHYLSETMVARLQASGVAVDVSDRETADKEGDRYVAVSE